MRRASVVNVLRLSALCPAAWNCIYVLRCLGSNNIAWKKNVEQIIVFGVAIVFFLPFCAVCTHFPSRSLKIFIFFFAFISFSFSCFFLFFRFLWRKWKPFAKNMRRDRMQKKKIKIPYCVCIVIVAVVVCLCCRLSCVLFGVVDMTGRHRCHSKCMYLCMELHDFDIKIPETHFFSLLSRSFAKRNESEKRTSRWVSTMEVHA